MLPAAKPKYAASIVFIVKPQLAGKFIGYNILIRECVEVNHTHLSRVFDSCYLNHDWSLGITARVE